MKMLIATSVVLSERAEDGARHLSISSQTETIIVELSPQLWEKLGNTAKWFFSKVHEEPQPAAEAVEEPQPAAEAVEEPQPAAEAVEEPQPAAEAVEEEKVPDARV